MCKCVCDGVGKECMYVCVSLQVRVCICMHVTVHVLTARIRVTGPVSPHLPPSRIIDLHEFVSGAHKYDQAIRSTLCWKEERSPRLSHRVL